MAEEDDFSFDIDKEEKEQVQDRVRELEEELTRFKLSFIPEDKITFMLVLGEVIIVLYGLQFLLRQVQLF